MNRIDRGATGPDAGFTLIELIVVITVIGVLLALAVPSFVGLQQTVQNAATRGDLGNDRTALVSWGIDNNGAVPASGSFNPSSSGLNLAAYGWSVSDSTTGYLYSTNAGSTAWCLQMTSASTTVWRVSQNKPITSGTCAALGVGNY